jgi:hypothetical protein
LAPIGPEREWSAEFAATLIEENDEGWNHVAVPELWWDRIAET